MYIHKYLHIYIYIYMNICIYVFIYVCNIYIFVATIESNIKYYENIKALWI